MSKTLTRNDKVEYIVIDGADVEKAAKGSPSRCVIAQHIRKKHPELTRIKVGKQTIAGTYAELGVRVVWSTPMSVRKAIEAFDKGEEFEFPNFTLRYSEADHRPMYSHIPKNAPDREARIEEVKANNRSYQRDVAAGNRNPKTLTAAQRRKYERQRRNA